MKKQPTGKWGNILANDIVVNYKELIFSIHKEPKKNIKKHLLKMRR